MKIKDRYPFNTFTGQTQAELVAGVEMMIDEIINSPKTFGITDKEGRGTAILIEDIIKILNI